MNCFINPDNKTEFICICGDTLIYKLQNEGGLISYSIFFGNYWIVNDRIIPESNSFFYFSTDYFVTDNGSVNKTKLTFLEYDGSPLQYANILIKNPNKKRRLLRKQTDIAGHVYVSRSQLKKLKLQAEEVFVSTFCYSALFNLHLEIGKQYTFRPLIEDCFFDYDVPKSFFLIYTADSIYIKSFNSREKYFIKTSTEVSCTNLLYSK
jgi:hypothetical protein